MISQIGRTRGRIAALALGLAAGVCLAGCGNGLEVAGPSPTSSQQVVVPNSPGASPTKAPSSAPQNPPSVAPPPPGAPSAPPTQSGGTQSAPPPSASPSSTNSLAKCGLDDLAVTLRSPAGNGAAGSQYVLLAFLNKSSQPCTIYGYPGVSFVGDQNGTQLGKPAVRATTRTATEVLLRPGVSKSALLQVAESGNFDPEKCQPTTSDGFRVYPPDSFTSAYVPFKASACQSKKVAQLTVYPVGANS